MSKGQTGEISPAVTYNLNEGTKAFGKIGVTFCKSVCGDDIDRILIRQIFRSGTSV